MNQHIGENESMKRITRIRLYLCVLYRQMTGATAAGYYESFE